MFADVMQAALPTDPPADTIIVTAGRALPESASERFYTVERIYERDLRHARSTRIDQVLKSVADVRLFRRSDARSGHPTVAWPLTQKLHLTARAENIFDEVVEAGIGLTGRSNARHRAPFGSV